MNKKIINTLFKNINYYLLIIVGFILLLMYIYISFVRARLPRDIPFMLTETRFYILLFICCIYLYGIKQILYPKKPNNMIIIISHYISKPFIFLDSFIKYNKLIYPYYLKLFNHITNSLEFLDRPECALFIYLFQLMPRILLLFILFTDIFFVHKIEVFYYFILLGIFPIIYYYIVYSLEFALEQYIGSLETLYEDVFVYEKDNYNIEDFEIFDDTHDTYTPKKNAIYHDKIISIRKYIEIQAEAMLNYDIDDEETQYEYIGHPNVRDNILETYKAKYKGVEQELTSQDSKALVMQFHALMPKLLILHIFLNIIKHTPLYCYIPYVKIFIYIGYFICWSYILFVSFPTINNFDITWTILQLILEKFETYDPFSLLEIKNE